MPTISRFYGIVIFMNYNDHSPPHFHARFQDEEVTVTIEAGLVQGRMARPRLQLVLDWYDLHVDELMDNWSRARARRPLAQISPLP